MSKQKQSLQEQLLKSGLVTTAQVKTAKTEKRKQNQHQRKANVSLVDETKELVQKAKVEQAERDRQLNQQIKQQDEKKQLNAQVKQLIELNKQAKDDDGLAFHFSENNKIKTLYVSEAMREQLISGRLAIVKEDETYEVVSSEIAEKIKLRDSASVIFLNQQCVNTKDDSEDPYAEYQVPDDLMW
jgi:uncharacterized protein